MKEVTETTRLLLELVASEHSRQRDALLQEAQVRATELQMQAHRQARGQLRAAFQEARRLADDRLHNLEATLATARRMQQQRAESAFIEEVWRLLPAALEACWHAPDARGRWIERVLLLALDSLPATGWSVAHPIDLPAPEVDAMRVRLAAALEQEPSLHAEGSIRIGLRVRAGHNVLDGTLEGLLCDRASVGARVLALATRAAGE